MEAVHGPIALSQWGRICRVNKISCLVIFYSWLHCGVFFCLLFWAKHDFSPHFAVNIHGCFPDSSLENDNLGHEEKRNAPVSFLILLFACWQKLLIEADTVMAFVWGDVTVSGVCFIPFISPCCFHS